MAVPGNVIYFAGYDTLRYNQNSPIKNYMSDNYSPLAAGSVARVAAALAVSPIEMLRTRMQATTGDATNVLKTTLTGLGDLVKSQGVTSLWRGLSITMWRVVPFSGFYWWGYEGIRNRLADLRDVERGRDSESSENRTQRRSRSREHGDHAATFLDSFIAGAMSGAVASVVTTPFDVGKTRQQVFTQANDSSNNNSRSSKQAARPGLEARESLPEARAMPRLLHHIFQTEGFAGLFRGWVARCLKVAPACAIMISSYEIGKKMARDVNQRAQEEGGL